MYVDKEKLKMLCNVFYDNDFSIQDHLDLLECILVAKNIDNLEKLLVTNGVTCRSDILKIIRE